MSSHTFRDVSRRTWTAEATVEHINAGSLQRIADAVEKTAVEIVGLMRDRDRWRQLAESAEEERERLNRTVRRLKKQLAQKETADA